jgi:LytS/YehU family sensor histidine kinase
MFGPIIGLFIGAITDILTVILTAGMFHYGYFIAALAYGFFSGLVRTIINYTKNKS